MRVKFEKFDKKMDSQKLISLFNIQNCYSRFTNNKKIHYNPHYFLLPASILFPKSPGCNNFLPETVEYFDKEYIFTYQVLYRSKAVV